MLVLLSSRRNVKYDWLSLDVGRSSSIDSLAPPVPETVPALSWASSGPGVRNDSFRLRRLRLRFFLRLEDLEGLAAGPLSGAGVPKRVPEGVAGP